MRAMVLAAGLGTRLRPLTYEITKPMVPVLDRPVMEHILDLLDRHGFERGDRQPALLPGLDPRATSASGSTYRYEEELLGTAGGVRACAEFFGDEPFLVISGDALTDIDLTALAARHREAGGIATLAVKQVPDTREYGVVLHDRDGRITGFQEKPEPEEALSDLGNCGIYVFEPRDLRLLPRAPVRGLGAGRVPGAARERRALPHPRGARVLERRRLARRAAPGHLRRAARASCACEVAGEEIAPGRDRGGRRRCREDAEVEGPVWIGADVQHRRRRAPDGPDGARRRRERRRRRAAAREHRLPGHRGRRRSRS